MRVFEDGRPQKLEHFSQGRAAAARLLLLLDASGSMTGELKSASTRMAAMQILAALDPEDEAALAAFDHKYWGVVAFTRDRRKVEQAMAEIEPFGATALHDALARASSDLASHGEGRRAVVVLTDGVDTASQLLADEVLSRSQALDVPIYAVSVVSPLEDPQSAAVLRARAAGAGHHRRHRARPLRGAVRGRRVHGERDRRPARRGRAHRHRVETAVPPGI